MRVTRPAASPESGPPRVMMRVDCPSGDQNISFGLACTQASPPLVP